MKEITYAGNQFFLTAPVTCGFDENDIPYLFAYAVKAEKPEEKYILFWELDWENCTMSDSTMVFAYDSEKIRRQIPDRIQKI